MSGSQKDFPSLKPGGHVCLPYTKEEEKHVAIAGFLHDGLLRGERCIYWGTPDDFSAMTPHLAGRGLSVADLRARSSLLFLDATQSSLSGFDITVPVHAIKSAVESARSDGFAGLRIAGVPDSHARSKLTHAELAELENALSKLYDDVHATGLCAFDQRTTDASSLEVALATHETAIVAGRLCQNPYFRPTNHASADQHGSANVAWMAANILEATQALELLEAENAALIVQNSRSGKRGEDYRDQIAVLSRAIEARDRLLITIARWLGRPLPAMCGHLEDLGRDPRFTACHDAMVTCGDHLSALTRLSRGLDDVASFLQMQVVLRPEQLDIVDIARGVVEEIKSDVPSEDVEIQFSGPAHIQGTWDRLRVTRLFHSLIRTARDQGCGTRVLFRADDLGTFVRIRLEFMLPHAPALSDSGERVRTLAYGPGGESDYERLALQTWSAREIVRMMGGTLGISTWADARVIFTLDLPKSLPRALADGDLPWRDP